jgi:hypothetical protein
MKLLEDFQGEAKVFLGVFIFATVILGGFVLLSSYFYQDKQVDEGVSISEVVVGEIENREPIPNDYGLPFFKTEKAVYFEDRTLKGIDPKSAMFVESYNRNYFKDAEKVFYISYGGPRLENVNTVSVLHEFDPKSFEIVKDFVKDFNGVYMRDKHKPIGVSDVETFEYLGRAFYRDKDNVYVQRQTFGRESFLEIVDRDSKSFQLLPSESIWDSRYSKDVHGVYYDSETFYEGIRIDDADSKTFTIITINLEALKGDRVFVYAIDAERAYYEGRQVHGADPISFIPIENGRFTHKYARDKNNIYYKDTLISGADLDSFKILWQQAYEGCIKGLYYSKDKDRVYFKHQLVEEADPEAFETFFGFYAKDKNGVYKNGVLQEGVDPETFVEPACEYG